MRHIRKQQRAILSCCMTVLLACIATATAAQSDAELAQRFRPFIKTALNGNDVESYRPTTWQWFVENSSLKSGNTTLVPEGQWDSGFTLLTTDGGDLTVNPAGSVFTLDLDDSDYGGEPWASVLAGDGTYAHVERVGLKPTSGPDNRLVNIDYTILWSNNAGQDNFNQHEGDLTFLVVLYDPNSDRIVRLTYPAHGCILQLFGIEPSQQVSISNLDGESLDGESTNAQKLQTQAAQVAIDDSNDYSKWNTNGNNGACGLAAFRESAHHVFLVQDPITKRFDHPALYAEFGTHESFPNADGGYVAGGGIHNGTGVSWLLPANSLVLLPSFATSGDPNTPFLHYRGKVGSDGRNPVMHSTWCWATLTSDQTPCVYANPNPIWPIIPGGFSDLSPYTTYGKLKWPPTINVASSGDAYVVPQRTQGNGTAQLPYGGLDVAATFVPANWTLHMAPGTYAENLILGRPMKLVSSGGVVTLTSTAQ